MYPFVPEELGGDFDLEQSLRFGTLPLIWQSPSKKESLTAYVELFLKEEIQAEARRTEVDFLLRKGDKYLAIEVKSQPKMSVEHLTGLKAIGSLKGLKRRVLVYMGAGALRTPDGIDVLPVAEFISELEQGRLWNR